MRERIQRLNTRISLRHTTVFDGYPKQENQRLHYVRARRSLFGLGDSNRATPASERASVENPQLETVPPQSLQEVLLKVAPIPKEERVSPALLLVLVLDGIEFELTDVISNLREAIAPGRSIAVNDGLLRQHILESIMQGLSHQYLSVVVVNLDLVELSKMVEVVQQIDCQIPSDALDNAARGAGIFVELGLLIRENGISKRQVLSEDTESGEVSFASLYIHALVVIMAVQQRGQMQQDVIQPLSAQRVEVAPLKLLSSIPLVMKNQGDQVILRLSSRVAGLIDEDREFTHCKRTPDTKNAGGKPPAGGSPPSLEDHFFIPQPVVVIPVYQKANICSTHRKVA